MANKNPRHLVASLLVGVGLLFSSLAMGQTDTVRLSCRVFLDNHGIPSSEVEDSAAFHLMLERLTEPYAQRIEVCRDYHKRLTQALSDLKRSGTAEGDRLWIDSLSCYEDYGPYAALLEACAREALAMSQRYTALEEERLAEERRLAEENALRRQEALDARWQSLLANVEKQHSEILAMCDGNGIADKTKLKELSDLSFDYRNCYGRFNLSAPQGDERVIARVERLENLQRKLIDSVLGPNGYPARIASFSNTLKIRTGKAHHEVYKSYTRVFKTVKVPTHFGQYEEFDAFLNRLRDICAVQQGYLTAVELREEIVNNTNNLRVQAGKRHKSLIDAYTSVLEGLNQVPVFVTIGEMEMFLETLREFANVQNSYLACIQRIDLIQLRGDSISDLCRKPYADLAASYRELAEYTNFTPSFGSMQGADFYMRSLDDFEALQRDYIQIVGMRQTIAEKDASITTHKKAPKILLAYYKEMKNRTSLTATFNNHDKALAYMEMLRSYIDIQNRIMESAEMSMALDINAQSIKAQSKNYANVWKAYSLLCNGEEWPQTIRVYNDLDRYIDFQRQMLEMQQDVMNALSGDDIANTNNRLKAPLKEKNNAHIRLLLGVKQQANP